jgi:glutathione-regulated potassium-efflux system ancillary protein KefF
MNDILVLLAHPDLRHSRVSRHLAEALAAEPGVRLRDLYALHPDFWIDADAEREALRAARLVVWLHPIHWYGMPPLMKLWLDEVLSYGWAYGPGGTQLAGKDLLLVASTGGDEASYSAEGTHGQSFEAFLPPYRQTASLCRMRFLAPALFHDAHRAPKAQLQAFTEQLLQRLRRHPEGEEGVWPVVPQVNRSERPEDGSEGPR